jgi:3-oxoacyl-[acyl-carrier-protein] synthase II
MVETPRETWITGIGILSHLGEGGEAHWKGLNAPPPPPDTETFAPAIIHPLAAVDFDKQIPKKGDQRQMEPWQRIGTYAAGMAIDDAGLKGNADVLGRMDMIVAAGGGERDLAVDGAILSVMRDAADPARLLNERLMNDLRPTLFLAQLSNLLAGNISIVHGVTGSSRTFMGEEAAGFDAVRIAYARIQSAQSEIALVGGSYNAARKDMLMLYEFGGYLLKGNCRGIWDRGPDGGLVFGSMGAFLVLEAADHARARGAKPLARMSAIVTDSHRRQAGSVTSSLDRMWRGIDGRVDPSHTAIISGATGAEPATAEERAFLKHLALAARATGDHIGHGIEPQFAMNIAIAALAVRNQALFSSFGNGDVERPMTEAVKHAVVTGVGHGRGEALALIEAVT